MKDSLLTSIIKGLQFILTKKEKKSFLLISIALIFSSIFEISGLYLISNFVSLVMNEQNDQINVFTLILNDFNIENDIYIVAIIICSILFFSTLYRLFTLKSLFNFTNKLEKRFTLFFVNKILNKDYEWYLNKNSSEINNIAVTEIPNIILQIINPMLMLFSHISMGITIFLTIFFLSPIIALVIISLISLLYFINSKMIYSIINTLGYDRAENVEKKHFFFNDLTLNFKYYKISNKMDIFLNYFQSSLEKLSVVNAKFSYISQSPRIIIESFLYIFSSIFLISVYVNGISIISNVGLISFLIMSAIKLLPVFQNVYVIISQFKFGRPSLEKLMELLKEKELSNNYIAKIQKKIDFDSTKTLTIENIKFNFNDNLIFESASTTFNLNCINVITGESGSGKSTLIDIVLMLLKPKLGVIKFGNVTLDESHKVDWLDNISYVPQNVTFYDDTIANNISLDSVLNHANIEKSLAFVGLLETVNDLKDSINHRLGENGKNFSGGQRQRLAIARAIYKKPKILILDEPTSALDQKNEILIMKLLEKISINTTVFLITHSTQFLPKSSVIYKIYKKNIEKL
jgi:ATP-binding cassette, subfamily B, bacterial PglK